jgi:AraC-like DNA-binding protein
LFSDRKKKEDAMKLYIKFMVSIRCKMVVRSELAKLGLRHGVVDLGEVEVWEQMTEEQRERLRLALLKSGLELMADKRAMLIEKIKNVIVEMIHYSEEMPKVKNSVFLSEKLDHDYTYLANLFSEATGTTIEHFIIAHKIERVKELLLYDEMTLTQIAYLLNYSSVSHLSNQFKKITGLTPSFFKGLKHKKRKTLESVR